MSTEVASILWVIWVICNPVNSIAIEWKGYIAKEILGDNKCLTDIFWWKYKNLYEMSPNWTFLFLFKTDFYMYITSILTSQL